MSMRITDLLDAKSISLNLSPKSKSEALDMAVDLMVKSGKINDREGYRKQVYLREEEGTTGIGEGIAIPHGKCDAVDRPGLAAGFVGGAIAANGTSGFLGALVAGFLAGYVVVLLKKICSKLPDSLEGTKPVLIYPLFGIFIVGVLMTYVVEPPIGALNTLINNGLNGLNGASAILLGALLGGMMSVDMGGPVNKAAYVFGTASIAAGNYNIMAAVMVGGMVPPIAIALATLIFKNKFTADERKAGPTNFIMGLSFITEGAIPFAASDPLHVLPACAVGSAAAGALSMAFNCTLMAPHGGIFVFLTVGNPLLYLVALAVGSAVGCVLLGVLKKKTA